MNLVHLAGSYAPDVGQYCIICGYELEDGVEGKAWVAGEVPGGWGQGHLILVDGKYLMDVTGSTLEELAEEYPGVRKCTTQDSDPEKESFA